jgi:hypothetical protein
LCAVRIGLAADAKGATSSPRLVVMLLDFEVQRCSRRCAVTDRALEPGDLCYSLLEVSGAEVLRKDFSADAWNGAPDGALGWWKSRIPEPTAKKIKLAPNEVLLELFDQLADQPGQIDLRYVLALLLVRRRVLRVEEVSSVGCQASGNSDTPHATTGALNEVMRVYCAKRDATYDVIVSMPTGARVDEIQQQLSDLLIADAN